MALRRLDSSVPVCSPAWLTGDARAELAGLRFAIHPGDLRNRLRQWLSLFDEIDGEDLHRRLAGIPRVVDADVVLECFARFERHRRLTVALDHDGAFEHIGELDPMMSMFSRHGSCRDLGHSHDCLISGRARVVGALKNRALDARLLGKRDPVNGDPDADAARDHHAGEENEAFADADERWFH